MMHGISDFEKELVYKEAQKNNPKSIVFIDKAYNRRSIADRGEEVIAFAREGTVFAGSKKCTRNGFACCHSERSEGSRWLY